MRLVRDLLGTLVVAQTLVTLGIADKVTSDITTTVKAGTKTTSDTTDSKTLTTSGPSSTHSVVAATHTIQVGPKISPHAYVPNNITANPGDVVIFEFFPTNHSVVKADYLAPCVPASEGLFYSGSFNSFDLTGSGEMVGPVSGG